MDEEMKVYVTSELDRVFKNAFKFTDKDIKAYIERILDEKDEDVILSLTDFFLKFEKFSRNTVYSAERVKAGKVVLDRCIKLYLANKEKIKEGFFNAMDFAIAQKIDPIKVATMENLRNLTAQIYQNTLNTLTQIEYENPITGEKIRLFNQEEFKTLIENCSSILCHVNEENVRNIVSILAKFNYDKESGKFLANTAEMIKNCGTLLTYPSEKLASNIEFLKANFVPPMSEADLVIRISKSPSILLCDQTKVTNFEKFIYQNLVELRKENPVLFPQGEAFEEFAKSYARKATFNIDKISSISGLTHENLAKFTETKDVLVKYLGAKNAFETFTDFNVLSLEPQILDGLLAKLTEYDAENKTFLRKFFIEHPARALNMLQQDEQITPNAPRKTGRTVTPRRVRADLESLPEQVTSARHLSSADQRAVNNLFENVKQTFAARQQRRVVNGVEELSEEEQEEREYMQEIFDRIQDEFDASACTSPFDEVVQRMEAMIDAKEGKGFAESRFQISKMRNLYNIYLRACDQAKELSQAIFPILYEFNALERESKNLLDKDVSRFLAVAQKHEELLRRFAPHIYKVDDIFNTVKRNVIEEARRVYSKIGMRPINEQNEELGDFNPNVFSKDDNRTILLSGLSVAEIFRDYARYVARYMCEIVPDASENVHFGKVSAEFRHEQIGMRYLLYASRMRWSILNKSNRTYENEAIPLEEVELLDRRVSTPKLNVLANLPKNLDGLLGLAPFSIFGTTKRPTFVSQFRASAEIQRTVERTFNSLNKTASTLKKSIARNSDNMEEIYHTDGALVLFSPAIDKLAVVIVEPEVKKHQKEIEELGVKQARNEDFQDAVVANYTHNTPDFSEDDKVAIAPIQLENK